jgi:DNA helicase HerA-like ATPase
LTEDADTGEILGALPEGVRVGAIGTTGSGKTYALRCLARDAAPRVSLTFIMDDDPRAADLWRPTQQRIDLQDCGDRPLLPREQGGSSRVLLTGDVFERRRLDPETVAAEAWRLAREGFSIVIVIDELRRAASGGRWLVPDGELARAFSEGRKARISILWATQAPQEVPREAFGQSDLLFFRMGGREASALDRARLIERESLGKIASLPRGDFILRRLSDTAPRGPFRF